MNTPNPLPILQHALDAALAAAQPASALERHWPGLPRGRLVLLAAGKAGASMAAAAAAHYGPQLEGLVLVPDGHADGVPLPPRMRLLESAHPLPDARSVRAAEAALALARPLTGNDRLLVLLSGGGSAVMALPRPGLDLARKRAIIAALLDGGADIAALNLVRTSLSAIKGGRLAAACQAPVTTLALSDVAGDDPALIASGPTVAPAGTAGQALAVLRDHGLADADLVALLAAGGHAPLASRPLDDYRVVASGATLLRAAGDALAAAGVEVLDLGDRIGGDARGLAADHAARLRELARGRQRVALLSGGETTVRMEGPERGRGGRNTEYLLQLAIALDGLPGTWALAVDSDGIDGAGGHAGALLRPDSVARARGLGADPRDYQRRHDSAGWFDALGDLLVTGPTRSNLNDLRIVLFAP